MAQKRNGREDNVQPTQKPLTTSYHCIYFLCLSSELSKNNIFYFYEGSCRTSSCSQKKLLKITYPYHFNSMEEKHVLTINGPQPIPNNFICLTHEYLNPCASSSPSKPLNLENIHFHRQQPFSLENASVTPSLIEHEIITNYDPTSLLVVDCS